MVASLMTCANGNKDEVSFASLEVVGACLSTFSGLGLEMRDLCGVINDGRKMTCKGGITCLMPPCDILLLTPAKEAGLTT